MFNQKKLFDLIKKLNAFLISVYRKSSASQIVGLILAILGIYLVSTSIQAIMLVCGKCEKGPPLGWLGIINPAFGLASFAEKEGAEFQDLVLLPLIGGIILIIVGILMTILCKKTPPPPKNN